VQSTLFEVKCPQNEEANEKKRFFLHFFVYYDIIWRFDLVILHPKSKKMHFFEKYFYK